MHAIHDATVRTACLAEVAGVDPAGRRGEVCDRGDRYRRLEKMALIHVHHYTLDHTHKTENFQEAKHRK